MISIVNHVFGELRVTWGRKFASRFKTKDEVTATKRQWAKTFYRLRLTRQQIRFALDKAIDSHMEWPPELPEFLSLCESSEALGLPAIEIAYNEVVNRNGVAKFETEFTWSHRIVEVVNIRVGSHVSKESEKLFKQRFKREWETAISEFKRGKLPLARAVLAPPQVESVSAGYQVDLECPIQKRLKELREAQNG